MPWYKTGTVSVTQNSNAVIGTGTAFIANSRVGDGFRGPDGRWYEVTNIASNTALSISPNYEGPTVASGFYSIMPVQGYQKDLADQVRTILNDYGGVLAVLGTTPTTAGVRDELNLTDTDGLPEGVTNKYFTGSRVLQSVLNGLSTATSAVVAATDTLLAAIGKLQAQVTARAMKGSNSDITSLTGLTTALSVAQGGTGGTTQAAARSSLGLGSAATATLGISNGNAMPVGAFGLGSEAPAIGNIDALTTTEFKSLINPPGTQPGFPYGTSFTISYNAQTFSQFAMSVLGNELAYRYYNGTTIGFSPWVKLYHTGNTTRGSGGALSAASPIVRIASVTDSQRSDLQEQTFEPAGAWGVANNEARGVNVERLDAGIYRVSGSLGLAVEGWRTQDPCSPDGGRTLGITESEQNSDGTVIIRLYKQRWTLSEDGEILPARGMPLDVPLNSWIDVRLEMPQADYPPPQADQKTE